MNILLFVGYAGARNADMKVSFLLLFEFFWGDSIDKFDLVSSFGLESDEGTLRVDQN